MLKYEHILKKDIYTTGQMSVIASQITYNLIIYSTVCSG